MKSLSGFLSVLVLVLTVLSALVLALHVENLDFAVTMPKSPPTPRVTDTSAFTPPVRSRNIIPLARLFVLPNFSPKKTLAAVMIENHEEARPYHRGLQDAVMIQEFFVEGFITRFSALFDIRKPPKLLGPVRSLRPYFVDGLEPFTSAILHAGGSPEALERIEEDPELTSFNGLWLEDHFVRVDNVPAPHDIFLSHSGILDLLGEKNLKEVSWPPYRTGSAAEGEQAQRIRINFSSPLHNIEYTYEPLRRSYKRRNGALVNDAHPRNVLILSMPVTGIGAYGRLSIDTVGIGEAILFRSGRVYQGAWSRDNVAEPFVFTDASGEEFVFASGQTWMTVVEDMARVTWEGINEE